MTIDVTFDFRSDTPTNRDADTYSATLHRYHKLVWSKPLPDGQMFDLTDTSRWTYLHRRSELGEFQLASDAAMQTFTRHVALKSVTDPLGEQHTENSRFSATPSVR